MPDGDRQPSRRPPATGPEAALARRASITTLLGALAAPTPDPAAWVALKALAAEQKGRGESYLSTLLGQRLNSIESDAAAPPWSTLWRKCSWRSKSPPC